MRPLSQNIKTARKKKGVSQSRAAQKIGIDRPRYAKYEEGINPPLELLKIILEYYGIKEEDTHPFIYNENFFNKK